MARRGALPLLGSAVVILAVAPSAVAREEFFRIDPQMRVATALTTSEPPLSVMLAQGSADAGPTERAVNPNPSSIVRAEWVRVRRLGVPRDCYAPDTICMRTIYEARIEVVGTIAGPPVPSPLTVRLGAYIPPRRGAQAWLIVVKGQAHEYWPSSPLYGTTAERRDEICVSREQLAVFGVTAPPGGRERGEDLCYQF